MAGKLGRREPKNAPAIPFAAIVRAGAVPQHPSSVDYGSQLSGWQMLGNDQFGDCVAVTWANSRRLVTHYLGAVEVYPTLPQVLSIYKTQNPGFPSQDDGMDIQTLLEWLTKNAGPDGAKVLAFAKVDVSNDDEMKAAVAIFGNLWIGITVRTANMDEFDAHKPWDYVPSSPIEGGHAVMVPGYSLSSTRELDLITWGEETALTSKFADAQLDEAWVVIWQEHLGDHAFLAGIDMNALSAAYASITGRPFPVPVGPGPSPAPGPSDADHTLASGLPSGWTTARHTGDNRKAALLVGAWLKAKGLD